MAGQHLLGERIELHQGGGGHQPMQFEQFGLAGRVGHLQAHLEATLLALEKLQQAAQVRAGQVVVGGHQQQLQRLAFRRWRGPFGAGLVWGHAAHPMGMGPVRSIPAMTETVNAVSPRAGIS